MKYKLINKTKISNDILHIIIKFVCPPKLSNFTITFKYVNGDTMFSGLAGGGYRTALIYINKNNKYPVSAYQKELDKYGYVDKSMFMSRNELLVNLCAHELRHVWQEFISKTFKKNKHISKKGIYNDEIFFYNYQHEKDASLYARKLLLKWRKINND